MTSRPERRRRTDARDADAGARPLASAVDAVLAARGLSSLAGLARVRAVWPEAVGAVLAAHSSPTRLRDGELTVAVDHPAFATELRLASPAVVERLGAEGAGGLVERVNVRVRPADALE